MEAEEVLKEIDDNYHRGHLSTKKVDRLNLEVITKALKEQRNQGLEEAKTKIVWVVKYSNYSPPEVIEIFDNEMAAKEYVEKSDDPLEYVQWEVKTTSTSI